MSEKKLHLKEKLSNIIHKLSKMEIKKSGHNKFVGYDYYELEDFVPQLIELMHEERVYSSYQVTENEAKLILSDVDSDEERIIKIPFVPSNLKGATEMQNIGASITYARRYLLMLAFHIVESDQLDAVQGEPFGKPRLVKASKYIIDQIKEKLNEAVKTGVLTKEELLRRFPQIQKSELEKLNYNEANKLLEKVTDIF